MTTGTEEQKATDPAEESQKEMENLENEEDE